MALVPLLLVLCSLASGWILESPSAEERLFRRLTLDAAGTPQPARAAAALSNPTGLLVVGLRIFATEFRRDRVVVAPTARARRRNGDARGEWRVFADRGPHCARRFPESAVDCAILDGAWGLASYRSTLFVSSFGSDQVLAFDRKTRAFLYALGGGGSLDSPEGLALAGTRLFVSSFLDSRVVAFELEPSLEQRAAAAAAASSDAHATLALGPPVEIDLEATQFRADSTFGEVAARSERRRAAALWGEQSEESDEAPFHARMHGPEQLVYVAGRGSLVVSSSHNESVLEIGAQDGQLRSVLADAADGLQGPLGLALAAPNASGPLRAVLRWESAVPEAVLLVASYRSDAVYALDLSLNSPRLEKLPLADKRLVGPSAIALDARDPSALYLACYETGAVLYFNVSEIHERHRADAAFLMSTSSSPHQRRRTLAE